MSLETEFIQFEEHDPNDSLEDEYTLCVQVLSGTFNKLVEMYNRDMSLTPFGDRYTQPFQLGNVDSHLNFVCWVSDQLKKLTA